MNGSESGPGGAVIVDGTFNTRDVGGLKTSSGARIATGRLLRSASLDAVTERGIEQLRALEIRTVLDLRSQNEIDRHGRFPTDQLAVRWEHLASTVGPPTTPDQGSLDRMRDHPDPMAPMYLEIIRSSGGEFARGLRILAESANLPTVVHCTSGKDRTGMFVLLLHLALGVSLDDALVHYHQDAATTERTRLDMLVRYPAMGKAMPPAKLERMAGTNSRWVTGALASLGGEEAVTDWLQSQGCDAHSLARLRAIFLE